MMEQATAAVSNLRRGAHELAQLVGQFKTRPPAGAQLARGEPGPAKHGQIAA